MTQAETQVQRPLPRMEGLAGEFYAWCAKGELRFQRCLDCAGWRHVPRVTCPECASMRWEWAPSTGRGRVFTWTVATRPLHPGFADEIPYAAVIVEMDEGVRILSHVENYPPDQLVVDMPVGVAFRRLSDDVTLPIFKRMEPGA